MEKRLELKVGILGASGNVGNKLRERLAHIDFIGRLYLEVKPWNKYLIPKFCADSRFSRQKKTLVNGEVYKKNIPEIIFPVDVSEGYSQFRDCDIVLIAAGVNMPAAWVKSNNDYNALEKTVSSQIDSKINSIREHHKGIKNSEIDSCLVSWDTELDEKALDMMKEEYLLELKEAYHAFRIMKKLEKEGVSLGHRAFEFFPRNVPVMKKYASLLKSIGFEGLAVILTNVPDYCCNVFAGEAPELAERTMGMTYLDTMRLNDDVLPSLFCLLPNNAKIKAYCIGNHDSHMIFAPDMLSYDAVIETKPKQFKEAYEMLESVGKALAESNSLNDLNTRISRMIKNYAPVMNGLRGVTVDEVEATRQIIEEAYFSGFCREDEKNILANSIFDKERKIFYTTTHTMDGLSIEHYEAELGPVTTARLERCIEDHIKIRETFSEHGITSANRCFSAEMVNVRKLYLAASAQFKLLDKSLKDGYGVITNPEKIKIALDAKNNFDLYIGKNGFRENSEVMKMKNELDERIRLLKQSQFNGMARLFCYEENAAEKTKDRIHMFVHERLNRAGPEKEEYELHIVARELHEIRNRYPVIANILDI